MKNWSPPRKRFRFSERDAIVLFVGIYIGAMGTVTLAYFWGQLF